MLLLLVLAVVFENSAETYCYDPECAVFDSLDKVLGEELLDGSHKHLLWFWTLYALRCT